MNKLTFIQLIKNPSGISPEQLLELEKVVAGFPYCQSAYILIAKQAAETGSMLADQKLKKAAAYTLDRKNLKKLLSGKNKLLPLENIKSPLKVLLIEEVSVIENTLKPEVKIAAQNHISELPEEKIAESEEIKADETKEKIVTKEALSDQQRDRIIEELKENLKKLHERKIKAAWEELPEEPILVEDQKVNLKIDKPDTIALTAEPEDDNGKNFLLEISSKSVVDQPTALLDSLDHNPINYPIRAEDVIVEIKEIDAEPDLLLEYLDFLEEKRSIFRKNKKKENAIIAKIIKDDPSIPKLDINNLPDSSVDLSSKSIVISKGPISENFAKILGLQGKIDKAIEIYEQLILKNPEKKPYFEALIEKLKNKI